ncbi:MAG TPA: cytochrome c oxidase subunit 3 [Gemmatimonadales bacterium]|jgi:heme/copper-type cytochrome/quinol oxidase subunit 3|nr:cytochrome c oxidase subunit 3 [Gemmatimonadales bacterium]
MTAATTTYRLPVDGYGKRTTGWWGMVMLIATEATLFAYLLFSYFYLMSLTRGPWPRSGNPSLGLTLPNTILLLVSSGTMWWAESGIRRGGQGRLRAGLLVTFLLGVIFLVIQSVEYRHLRFLPQTDAYGSLFYTITGFHGAHVAVGLLMNLVIQARAWVGHFTAERHLAVTNTAWYWHFVDIVWLAVFTSLYLSPRFL